MSESQTIESQMVVKLKGENSDLRNLLKSLEGRLSPNEVDNIIVPFQEQINMLQNRNLELETEISEVRSLNINLSTELKVLNENMRDGSRVVYLSGDDPVITSFASQPQGGNTATGTPQRTDLIRGLDKE